MPKGTKITGDEPVVEQTYQEDGGVFLIKKFDKESSVIIDDPQR